MRDVCEEVQKELNKLKSFMDDVQNAEISWMATDNYRLDLMVKYFNSVKTQVDNTIKKIERIINE